MPHKAVIFDLDGTLLDTLEDLADSFNFALNRFGFAVHPIDAYKHFVGDGADTAVTRALPERARSEQNIKNVLNVFNMHYDKNYNVKTRPYPGILELLDILKSRGLKLIVLSNKPHDFTVSCVAEYFPGMFDAVRGVDLQFPKKPHPAAANYIIGSLKIEAAETLYIGDTATDMETAEKAGFESIGVTWGFRDETELRAAGAKHIVNNSVHILKYLQT